MLTAIIIDDEARGRMALKQKLAAYCPQVHLLGEAINGEQGIALIEKHDPQIVFLDIEMPRMNGFEMLHHIGQKRFHLIFTTAYDQYAIKAIRYAAFDYLLKPIDIAELQKAIEKIAAEKEVQPTAERIETLQVNLNSQFNLHKIAIPTMEGLLFFNINEIISYFY